MSMLTCKARQVGDVKVCKHGARILEVGAMWRARGRAINTRERKIPKYHYWLAPLHFPSFRLEFSHQCLNLCRLCEMHIHAHAHFWKGLWCLLHISFHTKREGLKHKAQYPSARSFSPLKTRRLPLPPMMTSPPSAQPIAKADNARQRSSIVVLVSEKLSQSFLFGEKKKQQSRQKIRNMHTHIIDVSNLHS